MPASFIDIANERGGKDNISVVFLQVAKDEEGAASERMIFTLGC